MSCIIRLDIKAIYEICGYMFNKDPKLNLNPHLIRTSLKYVQGGFKNQSVCRVVNKKDVFGSPWWSFKPQGFLDPPGLKISIVSCIYLPVYPSVYLIFNSHLSIYSFTYLFIHLFNSIYPSNYLCIHLYLLPPQLWTP